MRVPSLRKHATGQYFVHWGGRDRYLGADEKLAEERYWREIDAWKEWREAKRTSRGPGPRHKPTQLVTIAEQFFKAKRAEAGLSAEEYYRKHLARFLHLYGQHNAEWVRPRHLNALKVDMIGQGYAPRTINHDLTAVRVLYNWASGLELIPPINLKGVKNVPVGPVEDETVSEDEVRRGLNMASAELMPWLMVNYLTLCRPSEVIRLVHGEGKWAGEGVFRLDRGKMDKRASIKRHIILSPLAASWLERCEPIYSRLDSYSAACRRCCPWGPKILQKSAAQHLITSHAANPADVELLLGHTNGRLSVTYYQPSWPRLREIASQLGAWCAVPVPAAAGRSPSSDRS